MNRGLSALSPSASLNFRTELLIALSKSSRVGGGAQSDDRAGLRPPLKLHVQFSRMQLSRRSPAGGTRSKVKGQQADKPHLAVQRRLR